MTVLKSEVLGKIATPAAPSRAVLGLNISLDVTIDVTRGTSLHRHFNNFNSNTSLIISLPLHTGRAVFGRRNYNAKQYSSDSLLYER